MRKIWLMILGVLLLSSLACALTITQTVTVTVLPEGGGEMNIYSPIQSNVYNQRMIPINLTMESKVDFLKYSDNGEKAITICRKCSEFGYSSVKKKPFDDGFHQVIFAAESVSGNVYGEKDFFVDTKKPKITKTEPQKGFADGTFAVEFQEANPISLVLSYGNQETGIKNTEINLQNCYESKIDITRCSISVDLKDYDSQKINYWFNLTDIVNNSVASKPKKIDVCVFPCHQIFN